MNNITTYTPQKLLPLPTLIQSVAASNMPQEIKEELTMHLNFLQSQFTVKSEYDVIVNMPEKVYEQWLTFCKTLNP